MAFRSRVHAQRASRPYVSERLPWSQSRHHVFEPMPQRGIAYQPTVQTLGIHPATFFAF